jgi:folate-binding protein YgfZ
MGSFPRRIDGAAWTPLAGAHAALRARLEVRDGAPCVLDYGSPRAECAAVRQAAGLLDLTVRGRFVVTGADHVGFLQRLVSNEVAALAPGEGRHALFLTDRGRVVLDLWIFRAVDHVLMETEPALRPLVAPTLERYAIMDDVSVADATGTLAQISLQGPRARAILEAARLLPSDATLDALYAHALVDAETVHPRVTRRDRFGEEGFDLVVPWEEAETLWNELLRVGGPVGLGPVGEVASETLRVETSLPRWGHEIHATTLPLEAGLEDALDYDKGCYVGQEGVSRSTFVGRVRRLLAALVLDGDAVPETGEELLVAGEMGRARDAAGTPSGAARAPHAGAESEGEDAARALRDGGRAERSPHARPPTSADVVGRITSAAWSPTLGAAIALANVWRAYATPGTALVLRDGRRATVRARPLYRGGGIVPIAPPHPLAKK